ncbi:hypothetical protein ACVWZR_000432 [Bradyrhizobium sp. i1.3.1]
MALIHLEAGRSYKPPLQGIPMPHAKEVPPVTFEIPLPAQMMAIDGTWRRPCAVKTISDTGATIFLEASIEGLSLTEFFLVLSSTGHLHIAVAKWTA